MDEITIKLEVEQFAVMQKLLEPYVLLSASLNAQYRAQMQLLGGKKLDPNNQDELEEIKARG